MKEEEDEVICASLSRFKWAGRRKNAIMIATITFRLRLVAWGVNCFLKTCFSALVFSLLGFVEF